jgi:hypothetical protein
LPVSEVIAVSYNFLLAKKRLARYAIAGCRLEAIMPLIVIVVAIVIVLFVLRRPKTPVLSDLPAGALGSSTNPVKCDTPAGELEYLHRLRGPDGKGAGFKRMSSVQSNGRMLDLYAVISGDRALFWRVHLDMYCPDYREAQPIQGFSIVDKPSIAIPGLDAASKAMYRMMSPKQKPPEPPKPT